MRRWNDYKEWEGDCEIDIVSRIFCSTVVSADPGPTIMYVS
jgi:hypothetical protein